MVYVFILLSSFITIYRPWKAHIYNISVYRKSEVEKHFDNIRQLCFIRKNLTLLAMSDYPGGVVHVSSSSFCWIAALIGCQMPWHHCTHEEGVAAPQKWQNCRNTVCCCTVPVVDFEGRYSFGCLSRTKSVKERIIERDFPPTSKVIEYIDVFILTQLLLGNHY